jgi:hypothetical protein
MPRPRQVVVGFYKDNSGEVRPITKSYGSLSRPKVIVNPAKVHLPKPSWQQRPLYFSKGSQVHLGIYDKDQGVVDSVPIEQLKEPLTRGYESAGAHSMQLHPVFHHYSGSPDLTPAKRWQRRALAEHMNKGTVLELFAGKGNLSKDVWAPKASNLILVDKRADYLEEAASKLKGKSHVIVKANNLRWLEKELPQEQIDNLRAVDFDAFGSPAKQLNAFFNNTPIKRSMIVAVTDGSCIYAKIGDANEKRRFFKEYYGQPVDGSKTEQLKALDRLMQQQAKKHGFKVQPINAGFGRQTIYAGYKITPENN